LRSLALLTTAVVFLLSPGLTQAEAVETRVFSPSLSLASVSCERATSWRSASRLIGQQGAIKGRVAGGYFASSSNGRPTFLNLGFDYPDQRRFTVVIWEEDRARFGAPERRFRGRTVCVTGRISEYNGVPQIVVRSPSQIRLM